MSSSTSEPSDTSSPTDIAIIGMSGRFPGAPDLNTFWENLCGGVESITRFKHEELISSGVSNELLNDPDYVAAKPMLENIDQFDAKFFGFNRREAELLDPQHRLFLECVWEAIEVSGYNSETYPGLIGLYAGSTLSSYMLKNIFSNQDVVKSNDLLQLLISNDKDHLTTKTSYKLNLKGPSISASTACSTSLVAVQTAYQSLLSYQCDIAIAGGVSITVPSKEGYLFKEGGILSPDGHCRAFDADAKGTVFGNGLGVVVLKRLQEAINDGDTIHAIIKGAAINNDGADKIGYTAPSVNGQAEVIAEAMGIANVDPETIGYIEAHGTGTTLGDPIEIRALNKAYALANPEKNSCAIGSVKTNIGHLDAAAGIASIIKAIFALKHKVIPPTLNFTKPNPEIDFENSPFYVNTELKRWDKKPFPRRAGVSSFGVGGTNAHIILQEAPETLPCKASDQNDKLLLISATSENGVEKASQNLAEYLDTHPNVDLDKLAFTLTCGRKTFSQRRFLVFKDLADLKSTLSNQSPGRIFSQHTSGTASRVTFMFSGQGAQYINMARGLYESEPAFRSQVELCLQSVDKTTEQSLRSVLLVKSGEETEATQQLTQTALAQPAIFIVEYALAQLCIGWGIKPDQMLGHSLGEYVAACLANVISPQDALDLIIFRGKLIQSLPTGNMLAVSLSESETNTYLKDPALSLAAINGSQRCVISGPHHSINLLIETLNQEEIPNQLLHTSHAFHSTMMDSILEPFRSKIASIKLSPPEIPYLSNLTGKWILPTESIDPEYWVRHLRNTVRFNQNLETLYKDDPSDILLEIGPGNILTALATQHPNRPTNTLVVNTLPGPKESVTDSQKLLTAIGKLWLNGIQIDWKSYFKDKPQGRIPLPTYPFERESYWIAANPSYQGEIAGLSGGDGSPSNISTRECTTDLDQLDDVTAPVTPTQDTTSDSPVIDFILKTIQEKCGINGEIDPNISFMEIGIDSLTLVQINKEILNQFRVKIPFRQLLESLPTPTAVAKHIHDSAPLAVAKASKSKSETQNKIVPKTSDSSNKELVKHGPFKPVKLSPNSEFTPKQQDFLDELILRYNNRTSDSKSYTEKFRSFLTDSRAVVGFRKAWKELTYPIVIQKAKDARIWDLNGNEYVDLIMGFGVNFFGHSPQFVTDAIQEQLVLQPPMVAPQIELAGKTAELFCELTKHERVAFCNTGSEAVMTALRIARMSTGKNKVVMFKDSYHGNFDNVLGRAQNTSEQFQTVPIVDGVTAGSVEDLVILDYATAETMEYIEANLDDFAAILIEPIQSRHPEIQPTTFIRKLRELTQDSETILIMDEVVCGFRLAQGGAQEFFGIKADIATYGKIVGGGMPIGLVAGQAKYLDGLDGGAWNYGDDSYPEADQTYSAGTFTKHPFALASAWAVLNEIKKQGPKLYLDLNTKADRFAENINSLFRKLNAPIHLDHCGSIIYFRPNADFSWFELFSYLMVEQGISIWGERPYYLTVSLTEEDLSRIIKAAESAILSLKSADFINPQSKYLFAPENIPLTEAQKEVWLASQLEDDASRSYNTTAALRLNGPLNFNSLKSALNTVVRRHEALRATFDIKGEFQTFSASLNIEITILDLSEIPSSDQQTEVHRLLKAEQTNAFDLFNGPLLRAQLIRFSQSEHLFLLSLHHIACDGFSNDIILDEIFQIYTSSSDGKVESLPEPMRFSDYAKINHHASANYWLSKYEDEIPTLELPTDFSRPPLRTYQGDRLIVTIDHPLYDRLRSLAAKQNTSLFNLVYSAFSILISRLSGQNDVVVGIPVAGQIQLENDCLVGHCANLLPLRNHVTHDLPFTDYLKIASNEVADAFDNHKYTFSTLVKKLGMRRDPSRTPLISVTFNIDRQASTMAYGDLTIDCINVPRDYIPFELMFDLADSGNSLEVKCDYNTSLFCQETIQRWLKHFICVLENITDTPTQKLGEISLLSAQEQRQLIEGFNQTEYPFPQDSTVVEWFAKQVALTPNSPAVTFQNSQLTYSEFNAKVDQLACILRDAGIRPESKVGICIERSHEMMIGIFAILRAGAAYVPIDPNYPSDRINFIIQDAQIEIVLTHSKFSDNVAEIQSKQILFLDESWPIAKTKIEELISDQVGPENLAYIIYTSGSTGQPKGVQIEHRSLINRLHWMNRMYPLDASDIILQKTPFTFDVSVWELFWWSLHGGQLFLLNPGDEKYPEAIIEAIQERRITKMHFVPSMLEGFLQYIEAGNIAEFSSLKEVFTSGEALGRDQVERFIHLIGSPSSVELHNLYGPTEATIDVSYFDCQQFEKYRSIPIGKPIDNTQLYLLDPYHNPMPIGLTGELYIGGVNLARGYLNRPELNTERFIPNPFSTNPDARLYKTGDLAYWLPDGNIAYVGRIDNQVKLRGLRIELGEIEVALKQHPDIQDAIALIKETSAGHKQINCYLITEKPLEAPELRKFLSQRIPDYMVPASYLFIDAIPLTSSGKTNQKALLSLEAPEAENSIQATLPETEEEIVLVSIWEEVMQRKNIGTHDNFFSLGGDSILAIQIVLRTRDAGFPITPKQMFEYPTIAQLATVIKIDQKINAEQGKVTGEAPLIPIQKWFFESQTEHVDHFNQSLIFKVTEKLDSQILEQALHATFAHHDALHLRATQTKSVWHLKHSKKDNHCAFNTIDLSSHDLEDQAHQIKLTGDFYQSQLDLKKGPIAQAIHFKLGDSAEDRLLIIIHHLFMDGVSWRVLLQDLQTAYLQISEQKAVTLPEKTSSFKKWAEEIEKLSQDTCDAEQIKFWNTANAVSAPNLKRDFEPTPTGNLVASEARIKVQLNSKETKRFLHHTLGSYDLNFNDVLLSALLNTFQTIDGSSTIRFDLEGHGREPLFDDLDVSRTIGWFTTLFPVTLSETDSTPETLLKSVKNQLTEFHKNGSSYGRLVYLANQDNPPIRPVHSDIVFNYLGQLDNISANGQFFHLSDEAHGSPYHPSRRRPHALEIECAVINGCLSMEWTYSTDLHKSESIKELAHTYCNCLRNLIEHCYATTSKNPTRSTTNSSHPKYQTEKIQPLSPEIIEHPLSFAQERLWFLHQLDQESIAYHIQASFSLEGQLDLDALQYAVNNLIDRQECFRSIFVQKDNQPRQIILKTCPVQVTLNDLSEQDIETPILHVQAIADHEMQKPFNLETGPLLRLKLVHLPDRNEQKHVLIITTHHIISDGWSNGIFARELAEFYEARLNQREPNLPKLSVKYTDYVAWQKQQLTGDRLNQLVNYWKSKLAGAPSRISLPLDYPRPTRQTYQGSMESTEISADLTQKLRALSQNAGCSLYMSLLATFNIFLHRLSGQNDIVIGSPVAGRNHQETEGLIGLFVNTLAFRTHLDPSQSYHTLQSQVRENMLEAFSMQELPFEKLVEELQPERNLSYNPVFQVFFNMLNFDKRDVSLAGIKAQPIDIPEIRTIFDITLYAIEKGDHVRFEILYNTSLFKEERIKILLNQWILLLEQVAEAPESPIETYSLTDGSKRPNQSSESAAGSQDVPSLSLENILQAHLEDHSEDTALIDGSSTWNYGELEETSNQLAHYLQQHGIGENDVIAILTDRCSSLVCALLGVIKSGAAFLILDRQYPLDRNLEILRQSQPKGFLSIGEDHFQIPNEIDAALKACSIPSELRLVISKKSEFTELFQTYPTSSPPNNRNTESIGYLAFTSGTTGKPQGIIATLEPLANFIQWHQREFNFKPEDRFSMLSGLAHDPLLRDIFSALHAGSTLCIPHQSLFDRPLELSSWIKTQQIKVSHLTPSLADMLLLSDESHDANPLYPDFRYVFLGGEALKTATANRIFRHAPRVECFNGYGCTETPQIVALYPIDRETIPSTPVYPIGKGINQAEILILNQNGNLAGIGEVGEICIYSPWLSQGYLNNDVLTQSRFISDPFRSSNNFKLYKTGDLGRYNLSKDVEYLGRRDNQLNLRGNRFEIQEIETAITEIKNIKEVCVTLTKEENPKLIAYVSVKNGKALVANILTRLTAKLPRYIIPQDIILVNIFPRTPNGKIDVQSLITNHKVKASSQCLTLPQQPLEKCIAEIWQSVLDIDTVYLENNFFALGGHSLKATQVFGRLQRILGIPLHLRLLFEEPSLKDLTERIKSLLPANHSICESEAIHTAKTNIQRQPDSEHYPLSHAQRRLWVLAQMEEAAAAFNMPRALLINGEFNCKLWEMSFHQLLTKHESLRTRFALIDGEPRQIIDPYEKITQPLLQIDLSERDDPSSIAHELAVADAQTPFDLNQGPLFRMQLLRLEADKHVVLLNLHHIISDGWSMGVLVKDFMYFYERFTQDTSFKFESLPISYRDYAVFQKSDLHTKKLKGQADYWHQKLSGPPAVLQLPQDYQRPPVKTYTGKRLKQRLPVELTEQLKALGQAHQVTLFTILLSTIKALLFRYTEQEDIVVGSPIAGRNDPDLENQIGFYVNTLPLRTHLHGDQPFSSLLHSVQKTVTEALDHQDYPFDQLVEEIGIQRDTSRHPLFDVAVVLQNTENTELEIQGLKLTDFGDSISTAKYDLTFTFEELEESLCLDIDYNTDLFKAERIQYIASHVKALLSAIIENCELPIQKLNILGASERNLLLHQFNDTDAIYPTEKSLIDLFDVSAALFPNHIAVISGNTELTYKELSKQASAVASKLQQDHDVKVGEFVGIRIDRSHKIIVGILGILKAGAAYVPIDPLYPEQRQTFIVEDSGVITVIDEDFINAAIKIQETDQLTQRTDPDSPAYVIYTSGSTGKPKGCVITQRNVVRLMQNHKFPFSFSDSDVWIAAHSFCFDFSVWEMYGALLNGGRLIIAQTEEVRNIETFHALIKKHKVTVLNQTPAAFYNFVQIETADSKHTLNDHLRYVIFGGDRLETSYLNEWRSLYPLNEIALINMYGITETTVHVTFGPISDEIIDLKSHTSPIGVPLPETRVYVCDPALNLQPVGVPGEIYVGGTGVCKGYLNRPELTAERFIKSPFCQDEILYRTGDLGVWLTDGTLGFIGRNDNQVQIRGYRIELGEISNAISSHPHIDKAVVIPRKIGATDDQLIAYFTIKTDSPDLSVLRKKLQETLPDYMIPAQFIEITAIPLTANGKVDTKALPDPQSQIKEHSYQDPKNELEKSIAAVWKSILKQEKISVTDNFFEIGGNSLLIVQVQIGLKAALANNIPIVQLFRHPTIQSLAEYLSKDSSENDLRESVHDRVNKQKEAIKRRRSNTQ